MNAPYITSGFAFSRNPIILQENYPTQAFDRNGGSFTVTLGGNEIYKGRFFPSADVNIAEILDAHAAFFPEVPEGNTDPVVAIEDEDALEDRRVNARLEYAGMISDYSFTVIPGGISRQNFKWLVSRGKDVFSWRFFNPANNFFLTTRAISWRIAVKETELAPLYFFVRQHLEILEIVERVTGTTYTVDQMLPGVYALDLDALRRVFYSEARVIANIFDIHLAGMQSCQIVIEKAAPAKKRHRLKFRNSLGVFEIIEVTGPIAVKPEYPEGEESVFRRYDPATDSFYSKRGRVERNLSLSVETGPKNPEEIRFLMEMIASEEVYLLDLCPEPIKVIPSIEDFSFGARQEFPESFTLDLEITESEINIMQEIIDGSEGVKPRIFSKQFTNPFN